MSYGHGPEIAAALSVWLTEAWQEIRDDAAAGLPAGPTGGTLP